MSHDTTRTSSMAPLGSSGTTPQQASSFPPQVQMTPRPQSPARVPVPDAAVPAQAPTIPPIPQDEIQRPVVNPGEDLVDHELINKLMALQPRMTLQQMTDVLNILHPDRHRNAATAALRRASPAPAQSPPSVVPAPSSAPTARPLTGNHINNPQRSAPVTVGQQAPKSLLEILNSPSRKRFTHPSYIPPFCNYLIQFDSSEMFLEI